MAPCSSLDDLYRQALSAQSPKNFLPVLNAFLCECNDNQILKSIVKRFEKKYSHFWEWSEKTLFEQTLQVPSLIPKPGHLMLTGSNQFFDFAQILPDVSIEYSWHKLDFIYQIFKNYRTIRHEKITKQDKHFVVLLDCEAQRLRDLIEGKAFTSKDFDIDIYKNHLQRVFDAIKQYLSQPVSKEETVVCKTHSYSYDHISRIMKIDGTVTIDFFKRGKAMAYALLKFVTNNNKKHTFLEIHKGIGKEYVIGGLGPKEKSAIRGYCRSVNERFKVKGFPDFLIVEDNTVRINPIYTPIK